MGKNALINEQNIVFKTRFYDLIIPKETAIAFGVHERRNRFGRLVWLEIKAEKHELVSRFFVGWLVYFSHWLVGLVARCECLPTIIYGKKEAREFLRQAVEKGYAAEEAKLKIETIPDSEEMNEEMRQCWKLIRQMIVWGFVAGEVILIYAWNFCQAINGWQLVGLTIGWAAVCRGVCWVLSKEKKK